MLQSQHKRELDVRDGLTAPSEGSAGAGVGAVAVMPPPVQHMQMQVLVPPYAQLEPSRGSTGLAGVTTRVHTPHRPAPFPV